ncbi:MAG: hypothetical protein DMF81_08030 [Acidobacteria bacterium]|nr:MAG: hypothetical protein DMF81_08030 [Acidobacteriota bacterium]
MSPTRSPASATGPCSSRAAASRWTTGPSAWPRPTCACSAGRPPPCRPRPDVRIVLGVHAFPPASTAGVEVYTLRLARALRDQGHHVLLLTAAHDLAAVPYSVRRREHDGLEVAEVVNVHHRGTLQATYDDAGVDAAAAGVLHGFRPDVVHFQHLLNLSLGLIGEAKRCGAAALLTLHDYWLSCPRDGLRMQADLTLCAEVDHRTCAACLAGSPYLVPSLQRGLSGAARRAGFGRHLHRLHAVAPRAAEAGLAVLRRLSPPPAGLAPALDRRRTALRSALDDVDALLAPTAFARDRALELGVPAGRVQVWPLGAVTRASGRRAGPRRRFGFVGTLAPHKGVHVLIEAFRGLQAPEATLDLHGSPRSAPERRATSGSASAAPSPSASTNASSTGWTSSCCRRCGGRTAR